MSTDGKTMPSLDAGLITQVVTEVLQRLAASPPVSSPVEPGQRAAGAGADGVFGEVDAAVAAARTAQGALQRAGLAGRAAAVECIRRVCRVEADELGRLEFEETRIGRLAHKIEKLHLVATVPGVEMLRSEARSGDHGLVVTEFAPYGVIGVVTPVTHSVPTLASNAIMMIAAGNALVCNPHPGAADCLAEVTRRWNRAIAESIGISNLVCTIHPPTLATAEEIFRHPGVNILCVTGGPGLARAALASSKRAIVAGPGNPPAVVDETADIAAAARGIIRGAAYDNNLLCIGEKEVFVVAEAADALLAAFEREGAWRLTPAQMDEVAQTCIRTDPASGHYHTDKQYVGRDPAVIAAAIGLAIPPETPLLVGETPAEHPLVICEQMMPVLPVVRCRDVDEAIALAVHYEHGFRHTATMWSRDVERLTRMGRACATTIYVKNGPSVAGLGVGGETYPSFSTASPTGEGVTNPLTFTRYRRCVLVDALRIL